MADDFVDRVLAAADTYEDDPDFGKRIGGMVEGTVTNNVDSLDMCRVKAKAAYCTEQGETDWLWPGLPPGLWTAPAVNTPIWIALWEGDPHHGMWFPWRRPDAYTAPSVFAAEADPSGIWQVQMEKIRFTATSGGSLVAEHSNGASITIDNAGDVTISAASGRTVTINDGAGGSAVVNVSDIDDGTPGGGAPGQTLLQVYNLHTHGVVPPPIPIEQAFNVGGTTTLIE
jgi:hypothetical protein